MRKVIEIRFFALPAISHLGPPEVFYPTPGRRSFSHMKFFLQSFLFSFYKNKLDFLIHEVIAEISLCWAVSTIPHVMFVVLSLLWTLKNAEKSERRGIAKQVSQRENS